ncbi:MAG: hypothetical protein WDA11_14095 [Thiohalomonadaceae bacterium]
MKNALMAVPASASSLSSSEAMDQKVVLYYPNGDWGLTPVDKVLSISAKENIYMAALQQLTDPDELPVGCYDEFPDTFKVEDVDIVKDTAFVTISYAAFYDSELSNEWLYLSILHRQP